VTYVLPRRKLEIMVDLVLELAIGDVSMEEAAKSVN
jgi:hypothetical protein